VSHAKACAPSADYVSGAMIRVDGGLNRWSPDPIVISKG